MIGSVTYGAYTYETLSHLPWSHYEIVRRLAFASIEKAKKGSSDGR